MGYRSLSHQPAPFLPQTPFEVQIDNSWITSDLIKSIISTNVFQLFLQEQSIDSALVSALDFIVLDASEEPNIGAIAQNLRPILQNQGRSLIITQGFICKDDQYNHFPLFLGW